MDSSPTTADNTEARVLEAPQLVAWRGVFSVTERIVVPSVDGWVRFIYDGRPSAGTWYPPHPAHRFRTEGEITIE